MIVPTVVCVLRSGGEYRPEHVAALHAGVVRWWPADLPLRFVALTDQHLGIPGVEERVLHHEWPGWWAKMELFLGAQEDLGDILYFDLDTVIVGSLENIARVGQLTMLTDFYRADRAQSGMMYLTPSARTEVCAAWLDTPGENMLQYGGDGQCINSIIGARSARWQVLLPMEVVSYKGDVRQRTNQTVHRWTKVVCFHGRPRPWQTKFWTAP